MGLFADDILRFRLKVKNHAETRFRKAVLSLDRRIVKRTPVDTGRARGNWQANIGPQCTAIVTKNEDKDGDATIAVAESVLGNLKLGDIVWIGNALPYIRVLEYGLYPNPPKKITGRSLSGFSSQAVGGMVSMSAAELGDILEEIE